MPNVSSPTWWPTILSAVIGGLVGSIASSVLFHKLAMRRDVERKKHELAVQVLHSASGFAGAVQALASIQQAKTTKMQEVNARPAGDKQFRDGATLAILQLDLGQVPLESMMVQHC